MMANILLAEDEAVLRMLVCDTLEDEGHAVDVACDGEEALALIRENDYDLIILDFMMPKLTGLEVIVQVRGMPGKLQSKIMMLSAKSQQAEQDKIRAAGADEFMAKPFSPAELAQRVGVLCNG